MADASNPMGMGGSSSGGYSGGGGLDPVVARAINNWASRNPTTSTRTPAGFNYSAPAGAEAPTGAQPLNSGMIDNFLAGLLTNFGGLNQVGHGFSGAGKKNSPWAQLTTKPPSSDRPSQAEMLRPFFDFGAQGPGGVG